MNDTNPKSNDAADPWFGYEPVIGLEVHCQLLTQSKLFCPCSTRFGAGPNEHTCPICLGHPGVLPVLNKKVVDLAIKMALAMNAEIQEKSIFARKQYFYPDLPKGYQISQFDRPYSLGGGLKLQSGKFVRLIRIHIEEDAGKNIHGQDASFIDVNRAGTPLIEIVSEPDLRSPEEASEYLRTLRSLARYLEVSDGNMEEGSFRCDANVSIRKRGEAAFGTRCEIKNINSFRNVERAIRYEILRQIELIGEGGQVRQETRLFDADSGRTAAMRSKEDSHDYRYFPDPDLQPLHISAERITAIKETLPELPQEKADRYVRDLALTPYDAAVITADKDLALYFEEAMVAATAATPAKLVANWVTGELLKELNNRGVEVFALDLKPAPFGRLIQLVANGTISGKIAKTVFEAMVQTGQEAEVIVQERGLVQVSDAAAIRTVVLKAFDDNPSQLAELLQGKDKLRGFFVGQIMKASGGKLNPALLNQILQEELEKRRLT